MTKSPSNPVGMTGGDRELVARCLAGDRDAFEGIYRQHAGRLYNLAWRMASGANDADDLLQEIFLQAYQKLDSFKGDASLGTWLYRLAVNLCLDRLRSRQGRMAQLTDSIDEEGAREPATDRRATELNVTEWTWSRRLAGCRRAIGRRSCCTTWKATSTTRSRECSTSARAARSRCSTRREGS